MKRRKIVCVLSLAAFMSVPLAAQSPRIQWTRQYGTSAFDQGHAVGYGEFGVYVVGDTIGTFQGRPGAGGKDAFISLHDVSGKLKWIRQFGSTENAEDVATGVAADGSGAYVVGYTQGALPSQAQISGFDSFIRKYDAAGAELWTRQFGSLTDDYAHAVAAHTSGVYVVGEVDCCAGALQGQPTTAGADAYVKKFGGDGTAMWTRMISSGDNEKGLAVAVDDSGVYVAGTTNGELAGPSGQRDGFVRKYNHDGALLWTRQFGTTRDDGVAANDDIFAIAVGPAGIFVAGATAQGTAQGDTFVGGLWDAFVAKLDASGNTQWYRQIGTEGEDYAYGIAVGSGHVLVAGGTTSNLVTGSFVGGDDAFLRLYDFDGNMLGTRQFGNDVTDIGRGIVAFPGGFFVGGTKNGNALDVEPLGDNDSFVMSVIPPPFVAVDKGEATELGRVVNAASHAPSPAPLAPGSQAVVFGNYLNEGTQFLSAEMGPDGKVRTSLGGTRITVNNIAAPILSSTPTQVIFQIPFEVAGQSTATVAVTVGGQTSSPRSINIAPTAPGFYTQNQAGTGEAMVVHDDGVTPVTPQNPARRNEVVVFHLTGLGALNPALGTGVPAGAQTTMAQISLMFGTATSVIEYAGGAPGFIGLNQINARIPAGAPASGDVPVSITVGGRQANPVTIAITP